MLWGIHMPSSREIFIQRPEVTCNRLCYQRIGVIEQWGQQESYIKMPKFVVETNVSEKDFPADWHKSATELIAKLLGKPIQFVMVLSVPGLNMTFGGTPDPCAAVSLTSIGKVDANDNRKNAPQITEFIESTLKIPKDRMYINIYDARRDMTAWNGNLFG